MVSASCVDELGMIKCLQEIVDDGDGVFVKRKKALKTVPPPAALFNTESEDKQLIAKANLTLGLQILDTDSEGEDNVVKAIKIRVCCYRSHLSQHDIY